MTVWVLGFAGLAVAQGEEPETSGDLQALIDAAEPGSVLEIPPGTYRGPVVVDRPLHLIGQDWPVVDAGGRGHVIEVTAPDVRIEGLVLRGSGTALHTEDAGVMARAAPRVEVVGNRLEDVLFGMYLDNSPGSLIEANVVGAKDLHIARRGDGIRIYGSGDTEVRDNRIIGGRDLIVWFSDDVVLEGNEASEGRYGVHFMYAHRGVVHRNRFEGNAVGLWLMFSHDAQVTENVIADSNGPSGMGIGLKDCDSAILRGNRIVGNEVGVYNDTSPFSPGAEIRYEHNLFAANDIALRFLPSVHANVFTENGFVANRQQVAIVGSGQLRDNRWSDGGHGNYWSDYVGYDADGDGTGDVPYRAVDLFGELTDRHPDLELFAGTPAARAVDVASRTFPVLQPEPKAVDDAPLVRMPTIPPPVGRPASGASWPLAMVSTVLIAVAVLTIVGSGGLGRRRTAPSLPGVLSS